MNENLYRGTCVRCGKIVEAHSGVVRPIESEERQAWMAAGLIPRFTRNHWVTEHEECHREQLGTTNHHAFGDSKTDGHNI